MQGETYESISSAGESFRKMSISLGFLFSPPGTEALFRVTVLRKYSNKLYFVKDITGIGFLSTSQIDPLKLSSIGHALKATNQRASLIRQELGVIGTISSFQGGTLISATLLFIFHPSTAVDVLLHA
ncbi:hypothetical protein NEFER03_0095 [Nematocida sp. LUAm3]|nr:hypothetical protein NEFER03_0095 [Nematocida sp. LUAm3]KAI5173548.1 hypothetical protein NEFER02_0064 [Nematocida sp. LUAm2]KAI5176769.1 hypothetical protein NEFER01_0094 [Nematocida sp. LUAm1]